MPYSIAIHGGAGTILRQFMTPEKEKEYIHGLNDALQAGKHILQNGGDAFDAVEQAVISLENNPLFNAGKGAVFNHKGFHELDAAIMCGKTLKAGAVAGLKGLKNPISLARIIADHSEHILLAGDDAVELAETYKLEKVEMSYYYDEFRFQQYQEALKENTVQLDHTVGKQKKMGTVGAVAIDKHGNLAAATSTGGLTNKKYGRIGDTPIIGAGTYANNHSCAISCTGVGEKFILESVAFQIHLLMTECNLTLYQACDKVVYDKLMKIDGEGGLIAIDKNRNLYMPFNSEGMYRACSQNGDDWIEIYK